MSTCNRRRFLGTLAPAAGAALGAAAALSGRATAGDPTASPLSAAHDADDDTSKLGRTPHTKFAVNIEMWFRSLPFVERIRQAAALGFPAVEFWPWQNKDLDAVERVTKELGIAVAQFTAWGFRPGLNHPDNHDAFVQAVEDGCRVAKRLQCSMMTVVGGDDVPGMTQAQMHAHIVAGLRRAAPIAEKHEVMLILEPMNIRVDHKGHCLYGSEPAIRICQQVDSPMVKINWDLYHMQITEGDLCGHLREGFAARQIGYLQLADHPGRHEPGTGEVHYNRVLREAHDLGYRGYVGLECRPKTTELAAARAVAAADVW
jgi:hydroxypyruvate isomerase